MMPAHALIRKIKPNPQTPNAMLLTNVKHKKLCMNNEYKKPSQPLFQEVAGREKVGMKDGRVSFSQSTVVAVACSSSFNHSSHRSSL